MKVTEKAWKPPTDEDRYAATANVNELRKQIAVTRWKEKGVRKLDTDFFRRTQCAPGQAIRASMEEEKSNV